MLRRTLFRGAAAALVGSAAVHVAPSRADAVPKTAFVLVHGSWHAGWCWGLVSPKLHTAGMHSVALDLPGHGLNAVLPQSYQRRPLDPAAFATEPSALAGVGIHSYADAVVEAARTARAMGAQRVFAVAHSMGGVPATFAAAKAPDAFTGLIYVAALLPTPHKPAGAYLALEDQHANSLIGQVIVADPAVVGALRIDPRSVDSTYLAGAKEAVAADVDDTLWSAALNMLTPDAPVSIYGDEATFDPAFGRLQRTYIRATKDRTLVPSTCEAIVADLNSAWPDHPTALVDIDTSHEPMLAQPDRLAELVIAAAEGAPLP